MSIYSGIQGQVAVVTPSQAVQAVQKWNINPKSEMSEVASSATQQAMDRVPGNDDWEGNYTAYGATPIIYPANQFLFYGSINGTKGVQGSAIMDEFTTKIEVEAGKEIEHSVKFSCAYNQVGGLGTMAALTESDVEGTPIADLSVSNVTSAVGCTAAFCSPGAISGQTWYAFKDVRSMELTIKSAPKAYHSSSTCSTDAISGLLRNWAGRVPGNVDVSFSIQLYGLPSEMIPLKSIIGIRLYVTPPTLSGATSISVNGVSVPSDGTLTGGSFWEIDWGIIQTHSGFDVDRKSASIIGATITGGLKQSYNGTTIGSIKAPGAANAWWPFGSSGSGQGLVLL